MALLYSDGSPSISFYSIMVIVILNVPMEQAALGGLLGVYSSLYHVSRCVVEFSNFFIQ